MTIPKRLRRAAWACATAALLAGGPPAAAARAADQLATPVRGSWTRLPLRQWAERMSTLAGLPVVVDRRIDPTTPVTLDAEGVPLGTVLDRVAADLGVRVERLASSVRLVPPAAVGRATAAEAARTAELRRLPADMRMPLAARATWGWEAAAEPRAVLSRLATDAGVRIAGVDRVPHDHLPAAALPPLSVAERIDLLLADYDLRAAWTADGGEVVPAVDKAAPAGPTAGRPAIQPRRRPTEDPPEERHTLRLEAPLDQAVAALARRFALAPEIDAASLAARGIAAAEIVRVRVDNVTRDELFDAVVEPLGLAWSIDGGALRVFAPPASATSQPP